MGFTRCSGKEMIPAAIFHGLLIDLSVPFFVSFFCKQYGWGGGGKVRT